MTSAESTVPTPDEARAMRLAKLFDLRTFIGALFVIFGVVVTFEGVIASQEQIDKAAGIRISLWTGLVMLALGILFLLWMLAKPPDIHVKVDDLGKPPEEERSHGGH